MRSSNKCRIFMFRTSLYRYVRQELHAVGEAGHGIDLLTALVTQLLTGGINIREDTDLTGRHLGEAQAQSKVIAVLAAEINLFDTGIFQPIKVDIPQPRGLAGEILATDGIDDDHNGAGFFSMTA